MQLYESKLYEMLLSPPMLPMKAFFIRGKNILYRISQGAYLERRHMPLMTHSSKRLCMYKKKYYEISLTFGQVGTSSRALSVCLNLS